MRDPVYGIAILAPYDLLEFIDAAVATGRATPIQAQLRKPFNDVLDRAEKAAARTRFTLNLIEPKSVAGAAASTRRPVRTLSQVKAEAWDDSTGAPFLEALSALAEAGMLVERAAWAYEKQPLNAEVIWRNRRAGARK